MGKDKRVMQRKRWFQRHKAEQRIRVKNRTAAMKAEGRCIKCGKTAVNKNHCEYHREKAVRGARNRRLFEKLEKMMQI